MNTDTDTDTQAFEADLAARMRGATAAVSADGVTRGGVEARATARRRRRHGGIALAAAALVVAAGLAAVALGGPGDEPEGVFAGNDGPAATEVPDDVPGECDEIVIVDGTEHVVVCEPDGVRALYPIVECPVPTELPPPPEPAPGDKVVDFAVCAGGPADPRTTTPPTTEPPGSTAVPSTTAPPPATEPAPTTTAAPPTSAAPTTVEAPTSTTTPYGSPCAPGSDPDCIDPEGDGTYVKLGGGADCMASPNAGPMCADLDGDGRAGYPDGQ